MIRSLQACRALAALSIVLLHAGNSILANPKYLGETPFGGAFAVGMAGVDFFFVLSGFLVTYVHGRDAGRPRELPRFLAKRFLRLYPAYWAVLLPVVLAFLLRPDFGTGRERTFGAIFSSFFLLPQEESGPILSVAWTLVFEVYFYLMFGTLILSRRLGTLLFVAWLGLILFGHSLTAFPLSFLASPEFVKYMVGMLAALAARRQIIHWPKSIVFAGIVTFGITAYAQQTGPLGYTMTLSWGYTLGTALLLLGLVRAEAAGQLAVPAPLVWLGGASYSIYLVHFPALSLLAKLMTMFSLQAHVPEAVLFFGLAAGALLCGCLFYVVVERPLHALTRSPSQRPAQERAGIAARGRDAYLPAA